MADWRYEGVICGYLSLYHSTGERLWLERAVRAGEDLVAAQLPSGKYRSSSFQQGPMEGGTPHEAAADVGLLELARVLQDEGDQDWKRYFEVAQRNIVQYHVGELWNGRGFRDMAWNKTLVPNKNATVIEALVLYEELSGQDMSDYLFQAAKVILDAQENTGPRQGGIVHKGTGHHQLAISLYTARAANGLLRLYERDPRDEWLEAVAGSLRFLRKLITPGGVFFGRYPSGRPIANPRIIAGAGDLLRALAWGHRYNLCQPGDIDLLVELLVQAQLSSGGIPSGYGFARRGSPHAYQGIPEFRDVLPVVGWCDKAFRGLAAVVTFSSPLSISGCDGEVRVDCTWKARSCVFQENNREIALRDTKTGWRYFRWFKGSLYPDYYRL